MLYINENEKTYIRSLYYTNVLSEQIAPAFYNPTTGQLVNQKPPTWNEIKALGNEIYQIGSKRYNLKTSEGVHNLLDDTELVASFGGQGAWVSIFHGLWYFYEGVTSYVNNKVGKVKSFFLGLIQLILALPGLKNLSIPGLDKWKTTIKNSTTLNWLDELINPVVKKGSGISQGVQTAMTYVDNLDTFVKSKPSLNFLSRFLVKIKQFMSKIITWIDEIIALLKQEKGLVNVVKTKVDQIKGANRDKKIEKTYDATSSLLNPKAPPNAQNTKNTQIATQDTTNPIYYKPKTMPTTLNYK